jgi:hypothetical protein
MPIRYIASLALTLCLVLIADSAQSQRRPRNNQPREPAAQPITNDQRGTDQVPFIVKVLPTEQPKDESDKEERDRQEKQEKAKTDEKLASETQRLADYTRGLAWFTALLFGVAVVQAAFFLWQLLEMKRTGRDSTAVANATVTYANAIIQAQRAYVKMSHQSPGIIPDDSGRFQISVGIKNYGLTPAKVTDVLLSPLVLKSDENLPIPPSYDRQDGPIPKAFLFTNEEFFYARDYTITREQMASVKDSTAKLYLIGYVDYIDQFNQRHRSGYARVYDPPIVQNNLSLVLKDEYNYDRPRPIDRGADWNET